MVLVGWLTRPFVSTIHLRLPMEAQRSKDRVMKFTQLLPPNATLEITAMRFLPWPKSIGTKVSELRPFKSMRAPLANLERIPEKTTAFKIPHRKFFVDENVGSKGSRAPGAWENIMRQIRRNAAKA
ncbi:MAG: hypothetical protein M1820_003787 [Bogoriella megaspora]|nr:MAG: hypothetical protein M1820_003787 [Bogoriella megaspora]